MGVKKGGPIKIKSNVWVTKYYLVITLVHEEGLQSEASWGAPRAMQEESRRGFKHASLHQKTYSAGLGEVGEIGKL